MYCPAGTLVERICPSGYYQDDTAQTNCKICTAGYYCLVAPGDVVGIINPVKCPDGHYCPEGTANYEIYRCPIGTWHDDTATAGNAAGLSDASQCTDCPEKFYCP